MKTSIKALLAATTMALACSAHAEWDELREALAQPAVRQRLAEMGALPAGGGAKELGDFVRTETTKWAAVIKAAGIKLD